MGRNGTHGTMVPLKSNLQHLFVDIEKTVVDFCLVQDLYDDFSPGVLKLTSNPRSRYDSPHPMCMEDEPNYVRT